MSRSVKQMLNQRKVSSTAPNHVLVNLRTITKCTRPSTGNTTCGFTTWSNYCRESILWGPRMSRHSKGNAKKSSHAPTRPVLGDQLIQCCLVMFARNNEVIWNINVYFTIIKRALFTESHITPHITLFIVYLH